MNKSFCKYVLGVRQWRHGAFCVSRQHRLCRRWPRRIFMYYPLNAVVFIHRLWNIVSRTISNANDTQAQQVAPNPCRRRFSTETPLSENADLKFSVNRELTNWRLSHDAAAGSRHSFALPSCGNFNLRFLLKTTTLVRVAGKFSCRFWSLFFFFSQKRLFVQPKCLTSQEKRELVLQTLMETDV